MRLMSVGLWASLSLFGLSQAFAADPAPPSQTPPATPSAAPPTTASPTSTPAPAASAAQASTTTPAAQPAAPAKDAKAELTSQEKNLISQGYKLETHDGQKYFCKSEQALGTRFPHKHCRTEDQILADTQNSKDVTRQSQQGYTPPPPSGPGR